MNTKLKEILNHPPGTHFYKEDGLYIYTGKGFVRASPLAYHVRREIPNSKFWVLRFRGLREIAEQWEM